MATPAFLTVRPGLRVNLSNIAYAETLESETDIGDFRQRERAQPGDVIVHFVGKRRPLRLTGPVADAFCNLLDGIGMKVSAAGGDQSPVEGLVDALNNTGSGRDFGSLIR